MDKNGETSGLLEQVLDFRRRGQYSEIEHLLRALPLSKLLVELDLCLALSTALSSLRRHKEAKRLLESAEASVHGSRNPAYIRRWQFLLAIQLIDSGKLSTAEHLLFQSLISSDRSKDQRLIADANNTLGILESFRGDVEKAVAFYTRSLTAWQQLGDIPGVGRAHYNMGVVLRDWGHTSEAASHFHFADEYFSSQGTPQERAFVTAERALLFLELGDAVLAERLARTAVDASVFPLATPIRAGTLRALGAILIRLGRYEEAQQALLEALDNLKTGSGGLATADVHEELAILYRLTGALADAQKHLELADSEFLRIGSVNHQHRLKARFMSVQPS